MKKIFHLPMRPYSPIDAMNRKAAALGSPAYASASANANYNGHAVNLTWNEYRQYYVAEYFWAGRVVLARGRFRECLNAVMREYGRGDLGSSAMIYLRDGDSEAEKLCQETPLLQTGCGPRNGTEASFWTWRHQAANDSVRDYANPNAQCLIFDWQLMQSCEDQESYYKAVLDKHGRTWV